jgi:hypothetical protein
MLSPQEARDRELTFRALAEELAIVEGCIATFERLRDETITSDERAQFARRLNFHERRREELRAQLAKHQGE